MSAERVSEDLIYTAPTDPGAPLPSGADERAATTLAKDAKSGESPAAP